jgi:hypothetical protein
MSWKVFKIEKDKMSQAREVLKDDIVSRQSVSIRDSEALEMEGENSFVLIEGSDRSLEHAKNIFSGIASELSGMEAKKIFDTIKSEESIAADGMGMIFG